MQESFREVSIESWNRIRAINLDGPFYMAKAVVEHMTKQGFGRIIGVTTSLATMWTATNTTYGGSKSGHEALASVIAKELEGSGVTSNVLVPGGNTYTYMTAAHMGGTKEGRPHPGRRHEGAVPLARLRCVERFHGPAHRRLSLGPEPAAREPSPASERPRSLATARRVCPAPPLAHDGRAKTPGARMASATRGWRIPTLHQNQRLASLAG